MATAAKAPHNSRLLLPAVLLFCASACAQGTPAHNTQIARSADPLPAAASAPPISAPSGDYRIGIDDLLTVSVWHQPDLSRTVPVLPDGTISLPLVGAVPAAGKTSSQVEAELRASLTQYLRDPELTVMVAQIRSRHVNIIGQVQHPGTFTMTNSMGVLDAISMAGGLSDFAKKKQIYVLRETSDGHRVRLHYNYEAVLRGKTGAQDIILQPNDTVVIP